MTGTIDIPARRRRAARRAGAASRAALCLGIASLAWGVQAGGPAAKGPAAKAPAAAIDYVQLHAFTRDEGECPDGALVRDTDGRFFGLTQRGGKHGVGTVYKISAKGKVKVLHDFGLGTGEGKGPNGSLVQVAGYLYGVTRGGGTTDDGVAFRISPFGEFTLLHSFTEAIDGRWPQGPLVLASDGNLYGTTWLGGTHGQGTVFRIDLQGNVTTLWNLDPQGTPGDPGNPGGGLILAADGRLVGTSVSGGADGFGTVFAVNLDGTHAVLHDFDGMDAWDDSNGVVQAEDGAFYGTTPSDTRNAAGVAFRLEADGTFTVLHDFKNTKLWRPAGRPAEWGKRGRIFAGTAALGGAFAQGGIWRMDTTGRYEDVYDFGQAVQGGKDGTQPSAGLLWAREAFYGTTCSGGADDRGTVFRFSWH